MAKKSNIETNAKGLIWYALQKRVVIKFEVEVAVLETTNCCVGTQKQNEGNHIADRLLAVRT